MLQDVRKVYRHEDKYIISKAESIYLCKILDKILPTDSYAQYGCYQIRSLYFDTIDNHDYSAHLLGVCKRKKIRLRIYDLNTKQVKLEIKNKEGRYTIKETATIDKSEAQKIISGSIDFLSSKNNPILHKVWRYMKSEKYYPCLLVDYKRKAYQYKPGDVRITFDTDIKAGKSFQIFDHQAKMFPFFPDEKVVLEVKYNQHLPNEISNILSSAAVNSETSCSKYCFGREMLY